MFEIKKNCPIPPMTGKTSPRRGISKYPFAKMAIGDCFDAPISAYHAVRQAAHNWAKQIDQTAKFSVRQIDQETVRIWRVDV